MFKDRLLAAGLAGLAGTVADEAIYWIPVLAGLTRIEITTGYFLAVIIFASHNPTAPQILVGELAHLISGSVLGITISLMLAWSGRQAAPAKGAALGACYWLSHVIIIPSIAAARIQIDQTVTGVLFDLAALVAWGAVTAVTLVKINPGPPADSIGRGD